MYLICFYKNFYDCDGRDVILGGRGFGDFFGDLPPKKKKMKKKKKKKPGQIYLFPFNKEPRGTKDDFFSLFFPGFKKTFWGFNRVKRVFPPKGVTGLGKNKTAANGWGFFRPRFNPTRKQ